MNNKILSKFKLGSKLRSITNGTIAVKDGQLIQTDLENFITVPLTEDIPEGVYDIKKLRDDVRWKVDDIVKYPALPKLGEQIDSFEIDCNLLHRANEFTSTESIRPAMQIIWAEGGILYGTNAHILYFNRIDCPDFDIPSKIVKLLPKKGIVKITTYTKEDGYKRSTIETEDKTVYTIRNYDSRYIQAKDVIPTDLPNKLSIPTTMVDWNKHLAVHAFMDIKVGNNAIIRSEDIDLDISHEQKVSCFIVNEIDEFFDMRFNTRHLMTCVGDSENLEINWNPKKKSHAVIVGNNALIVPASK